LNGCDSPRAASPGLVGVAATSHDWAGGRVAARVWARAPLGSPSRVVETLAAASSRNPVLCDFLGRNLSCLVFILKCGSRRPEPGEVTPGNVSLIFSSPGFRQRNGPGKVVPAPPADSDAHSLRHGIFEATARAPASLLSVLRASSSGARAPSGAASYTHDSLQSTRCSQGVPRRLICLCTVGLVSLELLTRPGLFTRTTPRRGTGQLRFLGVARVRWVRGGYVTSTGAFPPYSEYPYCAARVVSWWTVDLERGTWPLRSRVRSVPPVETVSSICPLFLTSPSALIAFTSRGRGLEH